MQRVTLFLRNAKRRLLRALFPNEFWNEDASREIDRLRVENERLRSALHQEGKE